MSCANFIVITLLKLGWGNKIAIKFQLSWKNESRNGLQFCSDMIIIDTIDTKARKYAISLFAYTGIGYNWKWLYNIVRYLGKCLCYESRLYYASLATTTCSIWRISVHNKLMIAANRFMKFAINYYGRLIPTIIPVSYFVRFYVLLYVYLSAKSLYILLFNDKHPCAGAAWWFNDIIIRWKNLWRCTMI